MGKVKYHPEFVPDVSEALIQHLETLYPPRCMEPTENGNAHQRYAGKVELVAFLRQQIDIQRELPLEQLINSATTIEGD